MLRILFRALSAIAPRARGPGPSCKDLGMASPQTTLPVRRTFGRTMRPDAWWLQPTVVFLGLGAFIVYSTWAAFQGAHYTFGNYLSPFYSPELFGEPHRGRNVLAGNRAHRVSEEQLTIGHTEPVTNSCSVGTARGDRKSVVDAGCLDASIFHFPLGEAVDRDVSPRRIGVPSG